MTARSSALSQRAAYGAGPCSSVTLTSSHRTSALQIEIDVQCIIRPFMSRLSNKDVGALIAPGIGMRAACVDGAWGTATESKNIYAQNLSTPRQANLLRFRPLDGHYEREYWLRPRHGTVIQRKRSEAKKPIQSE